MPKIICRKADDPPGNDQEFTVVDLSKGDDAILRSPFVVNTL